MPAEKKANSRLGPLRAAFSRGRGLEIHKAANSSASFWAGDTKRKKTYNPREGWENGTPPPHRRHEKERKKTDNPREGWEDGTPPPHRDFKERCVVR